jgi:hypothetical protein
MGEEERGSVEIRSLDGRCALRADDAGLRPRAAGNARMRVRAVARISLSMLRKILTWLVAFNPFDNRDFLAKILVYNLTRCCGLDNFFNY